MSDRSATEDSAVNVLKAHVALNVRNVPESVEFYRRMLGVDPVKVRPGYAKFDVSEPALNLTLNASAAAGSGALSHMGIQVARSEDVLRVRDRWARTGLGPREETGASCCYALQDKAWVEDPDGNPWEVFVVLEDLPVAGACCGAGAREDLVSISGA